MSGSAAAIYHMTLKGACRRLRDVLAATANLSPTDLAEAATAGVAGVSLLEAYLLLWSAAYGGKVGHADLQRMTLAGLAATDCLLHGELALALDVKDTASTAQAWGSWDDYALVLTAKSRAGEGAEARPTPNAAESPGPRALLVEAARGWGDKGMPAKDLMSGSGWWSKSYQRSAIAAAAARDLEARGLVTLERGMSIGSMFREIKMPLTDKGDAQVAAICSALADTIAASEHAEQQSLGARLLLAFATGDAQRCTAEDVLKALPDDVRKGDRYDLRLKQLWNFELHEGNPLAGPPTAYPLLTLRQKA